MKIISLSPERRKLVAIGGAAALVAGVGGLLIGRTMGDDTSVAVTAEAGKEEEHAEGEHKEGEHEEGAEGGGDFVALTPQAASAAGVEVTSVSQGGGAELVLPGRVVFAPGAEASVGSPVQGVVERVFVAPGSGVGAGAPLALVRSPDAVALRGTADAARADAEAARAAYRREARLFQQRITARQDLEAARAAMLRAEAAVRSAEGQLGAIGAPGGAGRVTVRAPIGGTVTAVTASPGAVLSQGASVAQIADQSRVEIVFDAPAGESRAIRVGTPIFATVAGGEEVRAVVTAVTPNPANSGAQIRARASGFIPPAGTPLSGRVLTEASGTLTVPSDAVQTIESRPVVFVAEAEGFRVREVVTGRVAAGRTEILRGLEGDERIAGRGAFLLKAELSRGEAEHEH